MGRRRVKKREEGFGGIVTVRCVIMGRRRAKKGGEELEEE
jgi:hypothetical protein